MEIKADMVTGAMTTTPGQIEAVETAGVTEPAAVAETAEDPIQADNYCRWHYLAVTIFCRHLYGERYG